MLMSSHTRLNKTKITPKASNRGPITIRSWSRCWLVLVLPIADQTLGVKMQSLKDIRLLPCSLMIQLRRSSARSKSEEMKVFRWQGSSRFRTRVLTLRLRTTRAKCRWSQASAASSRISSQGPSLRLRVMKKWKCTRRRWKRWSCTTCLNAQESVEYRPRLNFRRALLKIRWRWSQVIKWTCTCSKRLLMTSR